MSQRVRVAIFWKASTRLGVGAGLLTVLLLMGTAAKSSAQTVAGTLNGVVTDSSGAVIPNAKLTIRGEDTGLVREAVTNGEGYYIFTFVPIGKYTLTLSAQGF